MFNDSGYSSTSGRGTHGATFPQCSNKFSPEKLPQKLKLLQSGDLWNLALAYWAFK